MNVLAKFDEIPSMILQDIKETKRYGHTHGRSVGRSDNVKTVYPPKNIFNQNSFKHMFNVCTLCKKSIGLLD